VSILYYSVIGKTNGSSDFQCKGHAFCSLIRYPENCSEYKVEPLLVVSVKSHLNSFLLLSFPNCFRSYLKLFVNMYITIKNSKGLVCWKKGCTLQNSFTDVHSLRHADIHIDRLIRTLVPKVITVGTKQTGLFFLKVHDL
jgi:hypothetical protein